MEIKIGDILKDFKELTFHGDKEEVLKHIGQIKKIDKNAKHTLYWLHENNISLVNKRLKYGLIILNATSYSKLKKLNANFIICDNPRLTFSRILQNLHLEVHYPYKHEANAFICSSATIGKGCYIGHNVVIEDYVQIGHHVNISHNTVIAAHTVIGNHVNIGSNNSIGNSGFGYVSNEKNKWERLSHIGNVVIEDNVEIHDNTCIDRAVVGSTLIKKNAKIDNQVHIAHGAVIGKNSLIIAQSVIAGSTEIGDNCWVAPGTIVNNKIKLANSTKTGIGTIVIKNNQGNEILVGNPAENFEQFKNWLSLKRNLLKNKD